MNLGRDPWLQGLQGYRGFWLAPLIAGNFFRNIFADGGTVSMPFMVQVFLNELNVFEIHSSDHKSFANTILY